MDATRLFGLHGLLMESAEIPAESGKKNVKKRLPTLLIPTPQGFMY